jgi:hypothetical protein
MEINSHGPHQLAFRRKSVKVFEGAMNVLTLRAPSESGAASGVFADEVRGGSGAAAILIPPAGCQGILAARPRRYKRPEQFS